MNVHTVVTINLEFTHKDGDTIKPYVDRQLAHLIENTFGQNCTTDEGCRITVSAKQELLP